MQKQRRTITPRVHVTLHTCTDNKVHNNCMYMYCTCICLPLKVVEDVMSQPVEMMSHLAHENTYTFDSVLKRWGQTRPKIIIGLTAYYAWARAKHFGCHYPHVGISSEGIAVVLERESTCATKRQDQTILGHPLFLSTCIYMCIYIYIHIYIYIS